MYLRMLNYAIYTTELEKHGDYLIKILLSHVTKHAETFRLLFTSHPPSVHETYFEKIGLKHFRTFEVKIKTVTEV